jgi:hypothetical protein
MAGRARYGIASRGLRHSTFGTLEPAQMPEDLSLLDSVHLPMPQASELRRVWNGFRASCKS